MTNNTTLGSDSQPTASLYKTLFDINFPLATGYVSIVILLIVAGVFGNIVILITMSREKKINKHARKFILNIAVADLCVTAVANPMCIAGAFLGMEHLNGDVWICVMIASMCLTACICVFLNLTALTVNRWIFICHNNIYNKIYTDFSTTVMCVLTWVLGFGAEFPNFLGWSGHFFDEKSHQCIWDRKSSRSYTLFLALGLISAPFVLLGYCNAAMLNVIWKGKKNIVGQKTMVWSKTMGTAKTLAVVYAVFLVFWTPYVVVLVADHSDTFSYETHLFVTLLAHAHSSMNFFIYYAVMRNFRNDVRRLFGLKTKVEPLSSSTDSDNKSSQSRSPFVTATTVVSAYKQIAPPDIGAEKKMFTDSNI